MVSYQWTAVSLPPRRGASGWATWDLNLPLESKNAQVQLKRGTREAIYPTHSKSPVFQGKSKGAQHTDARELSRRAGNGAVFAPKTSFGGLCSSGQSAVLYQASLHSTTYTQPQNTRQRTEGSNQPSRRPFTLCGLVVSTL